MLASCSWYSYGFNGKENDREVKGEGDQIDYGMRVYDPRVARFLSVDPLQKKYPWLTPYQFAANTPIVATDLDGLETLISNKRAIELMIKANLQNPDASYTALGIQEGINEGTHLVGRTPIVGSMLRLMLAPLNLLEYTNRNGMQKNPIIREENNKKAKEAEAEILIGLGTGAIMGRFIPEFGPFSKEPAHIDIGGYGKYPEAQNYTTSVISRLKAISRPTVL